MRGINKLSAAVSKKFKPISISPKRRKHSNKHSKSRVMGSHKQKKVSNISDSNYFGSRLESKFKEFNLQKSGISPMFKNNEERKMGYSLNKNQ